MLRYSGQRFANHSLVSLCYGLTDYIGDVLNTREIVSVRAQSTAFRFFNDMSRTLEVPVHCLLGNHDMNLKHSHDVSSLDPIEMDGVRSQKIFLHR